MHEVGAQLATLSAASDAGPTRLIAGCCVCGGEGREFVCVVRMLIKLSKTRVDTLCDIETWAATAYGCCF